MNESWKYFKSGGIVTQLIGINIIVFLIYKLGSLVLWLFNWEYLFQSFFYENWELHADWSYTLTHPWTLFVYMFVHKGMFHILFNLIWLYFFGQLANRIFTLRHIRGLYMLGGLFGGLFFMIAYNVFPSFGAVRAEASLVGASASILAIVMAVTAREPNMELQLFLFSRIRLKYLTLFLIVMDILLISVENPGGHIAHIGGILAGWWFVHGLNKGYDLTSWINKLCDQIERLYSGNAKYRRHQPKMKVHVSPKREKDYEYNAHKKAKSDEIDRILDKLRQSGYTSLTDEEKKSLFDASKK